MVVVPISPAKRVVKWLSGVVLLVLLLFSMWQHVRIHRLENRFNQLRQSPFLPTEGEGPLMFQSGEGIAPVESRTPDPYWANPWCPCEPAPKQGVFLFPRPGKPELLLDGSERVETWPREGEPEYWGEGVVETRPAKGAP